MVCLLALAPVLYAQFTVTLKPETTRRFDQYQADAEAHMDWKPALAPKSNEILITAGARESSISAPSGLIHDWRAAILVPGVKAETIVEVLRDYSLYPKMYAPDVASATVLAHDANHWHVRMQLIKKKIITVVLNTEYDVEDRTPGPGRWIKISRSSKLAEVDNGVELAGGAGHGFLWRLNSYWLVEQRADGVYVECRSISLSRDIPVALAWIIKPMVTGIPRDSLHGMLEATVRAARERAK